MIELRFLEKRLGWPPKRAAFLLGFERRKNGRRTLDNVTVSTEDLSACLD